MSKNTEIYIAVSDSKKKVFNPGDIGHVTTDPFEFNDGQRVIVFNVADAKFATIHHSYIVQVDK